LKLLIVSGASENRIRPAQVKRFELRCHVGRALGAPLPRWAARAARALTDELPTSLAAGLPRTPRLRSTMRVILTGPEEIETWDDGAG
jgi:hypothetical protein